MPSVLGNMVVRVREINQRYKEPKVKLTKWTRAILLTLRLYLLFLVGLLVYAFVLHAR
jgi:hypothetical protein